MDGLQIYFSDEIFPHFIWEKKLTVPRCYIQLNNKIIVATTDFIKLKNIEVPIYKTRGTNRKKAKRKIRNKKGRPRKNHRNKMESIISVLKKVCGEHITAVKAATQRQQTRFRIIAYNAYRKSSKSSRGMFLEDFYAALSTATDHHQSIDRMAVAE